ncbi:MAG: hypothetical protein H7832_05635 [Magnetococcus sp. DMHC-6]
MILCVCAVNVFAADPMSEDAQMGQRFGNFLGSLFQQMQGSGNYSMEIPGSKGSSVPNYLPPHNAVPTEEYRRSQERTIEDRQLEERLQSYLRNLPGLRYDPWGATYWRSNPLIDSDPLLGGYNRYTAPRYSYSPGYALPPGYSNRSDGYLNDYSTPYYPNVEPNRYYNDLDNRSWSGNYPIVPEQRDAWSYRRQGDPYADRYANPVYPSYPKHSDYAPSWGW